MKKLITSALALSFISPVFSSDVIKWETTSQTCWKSVYKEEYVPGTKESPGYVTSSNEYIEVPCDKKKTVVKQKVDDNDLETIVNALSLGGDARLYHLLKEVKNVRDNNPDGPYKKILRDKGITI